MTWDLFFQLLQIAAPFVTGYLGYTLALRKLPGEAVKVNVDAAAVASKALVDLITAMTVEREKAALERDALEKRIDAMEAEQEIHRMARDAELSELKTRIQSDLLDTRQLRVDHAEKEKRINKLELMIVKQSEYIDAMNTAMKAAGIPVPQNGELLRSAHRLRLSIEERERLKAGK